MSVQIITCRRENLSTNVPAIGDANANGINRQTKNIPAATGDASLTTRTNPNPAIKLNQFPSSDINCPVSRLRRFLFAPINCPYVSDCIRRQTNLPPQTLLFFLCRPRQSASVSLFGLPFSLTSLHIAGRIPRLRRRRTRRSRTVPQRTAFQDLRRRLHAFRPERG